MDDDETLTAYHEAGHAVIAYALGGQVQWLQLGGEADQWLPDRFGECRVDWGRVDPACDWQRQREALAVLAGPVAEMIYRGEQPGPDQWAPWMDDWARAGAICQGLVGGAERQMQLLGCMISRLAEQMAMEPCWPAIAALADELLAHETLEAEQVSEVLRFWLR